MHLLGVVPMIGSALDCVGIWRDAWSWGSIGSDSTLPGLLEKKW